MLGVDDQELFYAYVAGFFDGEGSICIARVKMKGYSDNHRLIIDVAQHTDRVHVLHDLQAEFGGRVVVKKQSRECFTPGAHIANWHLQRREDVERFLKSIRPMLRLKAAQADLALQFLAAVQDATPIRAAGRFTGRSRLGPDELESRERFRLAMREANRLSTRAARAS